MNTEPNVMNAAPPQSPSRPPIVAAASPERQHGRCTLPDRRGHELISFEFDGQKFTGGVGRFGNGELAELFVNGAKVASSAEMNAQEAALLASLALQFGCPAETILHSLTRDGVPSGPLGALLLAVDQQS